MLISKYDPTNRFTNTVENYIKFRPTYPSLLLDFLKKTFNLNEKSQIADIGSGTGIFTKLLLESGYTVTSIEPNDAMREAAERILEDYNRYTSINAPAENTKLTNHKLDLIIAATAFHWFDKEKAKLEFLRILKPLGWCALIWNKRDATSTPFMLAYEQLLIDHCPDYKKVSVEHTVTKEDIKTFFKPAIMKKISIAHDQIFDWEGLKGRILSTSYTPKLGELGYDNIINDAKAIYKQHQTTGFVTFKYLCNCYYGQLANI